MLILDFINVGYGDAILVRDTEAKTTILVDSGDTTTGRKPNSARITASAFLQKEGIKTIDLLVLTHLHRDHSGGLRKLLDEITIREFWTNYLPPEELWEKHVPVPRGFSRGARYLLQSMDIFLEALQRMRQNGTLIKLAQKGGIAWNKDLSIRIETARETLLKRQDRIWWGVLSGMSDNKVLNELNEFINDTSIRMHLTYRMHSVFLPGDCHANMWEPSQIVPCEIVKLPHHGHKGSMTKSILDRMQPKYAVISVSDSRKDDCPAMEILRLLKDNQTTVMFTDAVERAGFPTEHHESVRFIW